MAQVPNATADASMPDFPNDRIFIYQHSCPALPQGQVHPFSVVCLEESLFYQMEGRTEQTANQAI
jgi:hypothetical protein